MHIPPAHQIFLAALGAAIGGAARFVAAGAMQRWVTAQIGHQSDFPWGTLIVNITGCLLMGFLVPLMIDLPELREKWRIFLAIGVLGGYTTFSAFALETYRLIETQRLASALIYVMATNLIAMIALVLGLQLSRLFTRL